MNVFTNEVNQLNDTKMLTWYEKEGSINEIPDEILTLIINTSDNPSALNYVSRKWKTIRENNIKINFINEIIAKIEAPFKRDAKVFAEYLYDALRKGSSYSSVAGYSIGGCIEIKRKSNLKINSILLGLLSTDLFHGLLSRIPQDLFIKTVPFYYVPRPLNYVANTRLWNSISRITEFTYNMLFSTKETPHQPILMPKIHVIPTPDFVSFDAQKLPKVQLFKIGLIDFDINHIINNNFFKFLTSKRKYHVEYDQSAEAQGLITAWQKIVIENMITPYETVRNKHRIRIDDY